ncbi:MAG: penicillin-binding protein 2 [Patescibacteria group bacterium]|nr:penicillin-binding protein 2 [Patescibacteria group bacterium]
MKVGAAFPDFIKTEKISSRHHEHGFGRDGKNMRGFLLPLVLLIVLLVLVIKLTSLTVFDGSYYRNLSDNNRVRTNIIHAPRGIIFDRNGNPLVYNIPGFRRIVNGRAELISRDEANSLIAKGAKNLEVDSLRQYPFKDQISHVLGYIGAISEEELKDPDFKGYGGKDVIGKMGIEKIYEKNLRGIDGRELVEVNAMGEKVRTLGQTDPTPGQDIKLTIDLNVQKAAYEALKDIKKGAVVVSTPDGGILALVSKPSFDPNLFTLGKHYSPASGSIYKNVSEVLTDNENQPLLNRAIGGVYPPGSTFKLITAAAGLEEKIIDDKFQIEDTGVLTVGAFSFANWFFTDYGKTDGSVDVVKAIKRSNDIFFYKLGDMLGVDKLSNFAKKFGLGEKLGIDLDGEAKGLVPTKEWKQKTFNESWYLGDNYHYGIGQGYLLTTPLQVNMWTEVIANGGELYQPHLLLSSKFKVQSSKLLSEKNFNLIRTGMVEACETGGVAWPLFEFRIQNPARLASESVAGRSKFNIDGKNFMKIPESTISAELNNYVKVSIACKTGTAQHGTEQTQPHAWITLFAPAYNPQIVITVLAESSGQGSNVAAPIAKKILEAYFSK